MLFHLYCLQNANYLLLVQQFGDWFWFMWNDTFRSLENDESGFGCFIINLSLCFWRSSWFSVSFLCSWQTNTCFFIGYLSCDLFFTQNLSNTFHRGVFLYLVMLLEINTESNNLRFSVPEICLWEHFYKFLTSKVFQKFCSFWSICCNMLLSFFTKTTIWFHNWVTSEMAAISSNMPFFFIYLLLSFVFWLILNQQLLSLNFQIMF